MSQPPSNNPYPGQPGPPDPSGQPPTGGQPPMGPPPPPGGTGGQYGPPGGDPYGGQYGPPGGDPYGGQYGPPGGDPYGGQYGPPGGDPYGGQYGPPPQQQKKTSPWLWVGLGCGGLFVIGVVLVVLIFVVFVPDESGSNYRAEEDEGTEEGGGSENTTGLPGIGEEVEHDGMYFTVTDVETGLTQIDGERPRDEYVIVHIDVSTVSGSEIFWADEQHVYTESGEQIEEDYFVTSDLNNGMGIDVDSRSTQSVQIAFDVPDSQELEYIGLSTETFGGNEVDVALDF